MLEQYIHGSTSSSEPQALSIASSDLLFTHLPDPEIFLSASRNQTLDTLARQDEKEQDLFLGSRLAFTIHIYYPRVENRLKYSKSV